MTDQFEEHRSHVRAVAYRMLGSPSEAEDAVQETWIRMSRTDLSAVDNLRGWLTTVVSRVCLDMLRTRASRREDPLDVHVRDPILRPIGREAQGPEKDAMRADSVGLALLVVLEKLEPAERLAFVLHDVFGMTFEEIAPVVDRSVAATRQLASRARRGVQGQAPTCAGSAASSMPFWRRSRTATSNGSSRCSIRISSFAPTAERRRACRVSCAGRRRWRYKRRRSRSSNCRATSSSSMTTLASSRACPTAACFR